MALTPDNYPQPETSQNASSPTNSSMIPAPESTFSAPQISSPAGMQLVSPQKRPNVLYRFFHPFTPFPIMIRGVIVSALWNRPPVIPASLASLPSEMKQSVGSFGSWYTTNFAWYSHNVTTPKPYIDESEATNALSIMVNYVEAIADAQATVLGSNTGVELVYQLLQIQEINVKVPRLYRLRTTRLHYHMNKQEMQQAMINRRRVFVRTLQKHFHLLKEDTLNGVLPSTFGHYDRNTKSGGWIVLNPVRALLIGVDTSNARILAGLLQRRDIDQTKQLRGIALDRYDDVLGRVSLWNAAQDINETVDQLTSLASSGQKSTDGQVLLSLTLAIIGILVALTPTLQFSTIHLWGTFGLLSLASILFWRYAHSGRAFWLLLGLLSIVCTVLLDIIHF